MSCTSRIDVAGRLQELTMTRFKLFGAALVFAAFVAPASAQQAVSEPAAAAFDPNFSIYSNGPARPVAVQPFNPDTMAEMRMAVKPHAAHRAPARHH
jgi:hypothetical protein